MSINLLSTMFMQSLLGVMNAVDDARWSLVTTIKEVPEFSTFLLSRTDEDGVSYCSAMVGAGLHHGTRFSADFMTWEVSEDGSAFVNLREIDTVRVESDPSDTVEDIRWIVGELAEEGTMSRIVPNPLRSYSGLELHHQVSRMCALLADVAYDEV